MNRKPQTANRKPQTANRKPSLRNRSFSSVVSWECPCGIKPQTGFSLISAIFLLVVIAALGTFAVTISTTQNQSQAMDVMGARAYQAALAGVEWAAFNVAQQPVNSPAAWAGCVAATAVAVAGNLAPFTVTVSCSATSAVEGANTMWIYDIRAVANTAGAAGSANYVEQVATARLVK